eukprot:TRINITY_DN66437_c0_g1_i1.p1 TRINITY_DN66437_c0_g1~~TRINITY_DN66437_c0_g1_i1.p1  ORF type:complete len:177 (+),score=20.39 TRINITY_DN66437_c0_g1_i1:285-815(+)
MTRVVTDMVVSTQSTWEYNMGKENIGSITRPTLFLQKEELERREFIHPIKLRAELDLNWLSMEAESLRKFVREDATISVTTRVMGKDTTFSLSGFSYEGNSCQTLLLKLLEKGVVRKGIRIEKLLIRRDYLWTPIKIASTVFYSGDSLLVLLGEEKKTKTGLLSPRSKIHNFHKNQ